MHTHFHLLQNAKQTLADLRQQQNALSKATGKSPSEKLRAIQNHGVSQYYLVKGNNPRNFTYLPQKQIKKAAVIAQYDYNQTVLKIIQTHIKVLEKFIGQFQPQMLKDAYQKLAPGRRKIIKPIYLPDENFITQWQAASVEEQPFADDAPEYYSSTGIRMRSKSEVIIADNLTNNNIPFIYEAPVSLTRLHSSKKNTITFHPDFTCLKISSRQEIIWEHFGLMSDPGYVQNTIQKINLYAANGYILGKNFIATFEDETTPLSTATVQAYIKEYFIN